MSKNKNRSKGNNDKAIKVINNDMAKYNNKPKNSKDSHERTFVGIPTELFILINCIQTDKVFDSVDEDWNDIKVPLLPREARYLLAVMGVSDGFNIPYDTMCKLTGLYDSGITDAKNGLIKKGLISLSEDKKQLTINYKYMYELFSTLYADECITLIHTEKGSKKPMYHGDTSICTTVIHDDVSQQYTNMHQDDASECTTLMHIQDELDEKDEIEDSIDIAAADAAASDAGASGNDESKKLDDVKQLLLDIQHYQNASDKNINDWILQPMQKYGLSYNELFDAYSKHLKIDYKRWNKEGYNPFENAIEQFREGEAVG